MGALRQQIHPFDVNVAAVRAVGPAAHWRGIDFGIGSLAQLQHGIVCRTQLLALGISRGAIELRLARGTLVRNLPGVYAAGSVPLTWLARLQATLLYAGSDAA